MRTVELVAKYGLARLTRFENAVAAELGIIEQLKDSENKNLGYDREEIQEIIIKTLEIEMEKQREMEKSFKALSIKLGKIAQLTLF